MTPVELARRLRHVREQAGIKQADAAASIGLDVTAITKIEHGDRGISALEFAALCKLYEISMDSLFDNYFLATRAVAAYKAMETALQLLTAQILNLRTELLVIKAEVTKEDCETPPWK